MIVLKRPLVMLDVETTGVHPQVDRVVQIGLVKVYNVEDDVTEDKTTEWQTLINPSIPIPPEVTAIHGITDEMVKGAPTFRDIAPQLAGGLMGCDIGGYNVGFNLRFLKAEFLRVGGRDVLNGAHLVDPCRIYHQRERRNLSAAMRFYLNEEMVGAHDALNDARAAWRILKAQTSHYDDLPETVEALHLAYFESPGEGDLDVDGKLAWRHGEATVNFGKHATTPLRQLDRGYLEWMLKGDFSPTVKAIVRECLAGRFPRREP